MSEVSEPADELQQLEKIEGDVLSLMKLAEQTASRLLHALNSSDTSTDGNSSVQDVAEKFASTAISVQDQLKSVASIIKPRTCIGECAPSQQS